MTKQRTKPGAAGRSITALAVGFGGVLLGLMSVAGAAWGSPLAAQTPGTIFRDCGVCPEMVVVPPGRFVMGSPESERGRGVTEGPQGILSIGYSFAVGVYEVTFDEWDECARTMEALIADPARRWHPQRRHLPEHQTMSEKKRKPYRKGLKADYRGATPEQVAQAVLRYRPEGIDRTPTREKAK